jgi:hypothetical protein
MIAENPTQPNETNINPSSIDLPKKEDNFTLQAHNLEEKLPLYVSNPVILENKLKSYCMYTLNGKYVKDPLLRRFSDFYALRAKIAERWPGVYIPNIPHKKTMGNLNPKFIEMRIKMLNTFLTKLFRLKDIFNSKEIAIFLQDNFDAKQSYLTLPPQSCEEITLKYYKAFPGYYDV